MLIETIKFEIRNFNDGSFSQFLVENTEDNFAMIASHKFTRGIEFCKTFDFQFKNEVSYPQFMCFGAAVAEAFLENEMVMEIDEIDEMVGTY